MTAATFGLWRTAVALLGELMVSGGTLSVKEVPSCHVIHNDGRRKASSGIGATAKCSGILMQKQSKMGL